MKFALTFFATLSMSLAAMAGTNMHTCYGILSLKQEKAVMINGQPSFQPLADAAKKFIEHAGRSSTFTIKQGRTTEFLVESTGFRSEYSAFRDLEVIHWTLNVDPSVEVSLKQKGCTTQTLTNPNP